MIKYFFPLEMAESVFDIDYDKFWETGIRGLIFDIDNTLATFDVALPNEATTALLNGLAEKGFVICFLSNNRRKRVEVFSKDLGFDHVWRANKPMLKGVRRALRLLGLEKDKVLLIGDQLFTDCWVGKRAGIHTVLTKPIAKRDEWTVKLKRFPEKLVMNAYYKSLKRGS
jgi:hypothetical protein